MSWRRVERQETADGTARLEIETDGAGHFRYLLTGWVTAAAGDADAPGGGFWDVERVSGLYGWRSTCRHDGEMALGRRGGGG